VILTKTLKFIWKVVYRTLIGLCMLLVLLLLIIRTEWAQGIIAHRVTNWLSEKTGTVISVDRLFLNFSGNLTIEGLYVEDIQQDTLLYSDKLEAGIGILPLLQGKYHISDIQWRGVVAGVKRTLPDSSFNFDFIVSAFSTQDGNPSKISQSERSAFPEIEIGDLFLTDFRLRYTDAVSGISSKIYLGELHVESQATDFEKLEFHLKRLNLLNSTISVELLKTPDSNQPDSPTSYPHVSVDECVIQQISFLFQSPDDSISTNLEIGKMSLSSVVADLQKKEILLDYFDLSESTLLQQLPAGNEVKTPQNLTVQEEIWPTWRIQANQIQFRHNAIQMDWGNRVYATSDFDPSHVKLDSLSFLIKDVFLRNKAAGLSLKSLSFQEQCGFQICESRWNAKLNDRTIQIDSLQLKTKNSALSASLLCSYASLPDFLQNPQETRFNLGVLSGIFSLQDAVCFSADFLKIPQLAALSKSPIKFRGQLMGALSSVNVSKLNMEWGKQTHLTASGMLYGLPNINMLKLDISEFNLNSGKEDIAGFLPDGEFPIEIPSSFSTQASVSGSINKLSAGAVILSSDGRLDVNGNYAYLAKQMNYSLEFEPQNLNIGKLLRQPTLGKLSGQIALNGRGSDLKKADASLEAIMERVELNQYAYTDISLHAKAVQGFATAEMEYSDSNLIAHLHATANLDTSKPAYALTLNVEGANLKALGYTPEDIRVKLNLTAGFSGTVDDFTSQAEISNGLVIKNEKHYPLDSMFVRVSGNKDSTRMNMNTPFIHGMADGNSSPSLIKEAITAHLKHYFKTAQSAPDSSGSIVFTAQIDVMQTPLITEVLLPGLKGFKPTHLDLEFKQKKQALNVNLDLAMLDYNATMIDSLQLDLKSNPDTMDLIVSYVRLKSGFVDMYQTNFVASVSRDSIYVNLFVQDSLRQTLFQMASDIYTPGEEYQIHLDPEMFILNGESWKIPASNLIVLGPEQLKLTDFEWKKGNQELHARTLSEKGDELAIQFDTFEIRNLTSMVNPREIPVQGEIQGELVLKDLFEKFGFTSDLKIDSLELFGNELGILQFRASSKESQKYDLDASLNGDGVDIDLRGHYSAAPNSEDTQVELKINALNISKIAEFSNGAIRNGEGSLSGDLLVNGAIDKPNYQGNLRFRDAAFDVAAFNGRYILSDELITVANKQIVFDKLRITDPGGNVGKLAGTVGLQDLLNPEFNLNLSAERFTVLNSSKADNDLFFGKAVINATVSMKGNLNSPVISAITNLTNESVITVIVPESKVELIDRSGVVQFVNVSNTSEPLTAEAQENGLNDFSGLDLSAKIMVDQNAVLKLIVDERSGDYIEVSGLADLDFLMDPTGRMSLSGIYELKQGKYKLSLFGVVKKEFDLQSGSRISWSGDPFDAKLDLTAIYRVKTSASYLMADQLTGSDASVKNRYRQILPFEVLLKLNGALLKPEITFRIDLPEKDRNTLGGNVYAKLLQLNEDESELNKQVFSLLVLNSFVPSGAAGGAVSAQEATAKFARSSVSQLLSDQMNMLSGKYIKGVDVGVDLSSYTDYQTGSAQDRTQLNVNVKKALYTDRLNIQVGSQFDLEGSAAKRQTGVSNFLGDVTLEYQITEDGRYTLKAFRRNSYEGAIDGQLILTGGSVSFNRSFNAFHELFKKEENLNPHSEYKK
jgi:translocation and assembly module TamB